MTLMMNSNPITSTEIFYNTGNEIQPRNFHLHLYDTDDEIQRHNFYSGVYDTDDKLQPHNFNWLFFGVFFFFFFLQHWWWNPTP